MGSDPVQIIQHSITINDRIVRHRASGIDIPPALRESAENTKRTVALATGSLTQTQRAFCKLLFMHEQLRAWEAVSRGADAAGVEAPSLRSKRDELWDANLKAPPTPTRT